MSSVAADEPSPNTAWPQAGGPNLDWRLDTDKSVPVRWSVSRGEGVRWQAELPNAGQSGIAVWGDRLFLTTFAPGEGHGDGPDAKQSAKIVALCLSAEDGSELWRRSLEGSVASPIMYAYSDSTSPTPVTDGEVVVFANASGQMAAFDFDGNELWRRSWRPWGPAEHYPFNKQHEPILYGDTIVNLEPLEDCPEDKVGWNYLVGVDKRTGDTRWVAEHGTTSYVTSVFGTTRGGKPAVLTGRGAVHGHPERPAGMGLVSLAEGEGGKSLWLFLTPTDHDGNRVAEPGTVANPAWLAMYNAHWDDQYAYWFNHAPVESGVALDSATGELLKIQSLIHDVDYRRWNPEEGRHELLAGVDLRELRDWSPRVREVAGESDRAITVYPAWHSNITVAGYHYFLCGTAHSRNGAFSGVALAGPSHCVGRLNIESGKAEYFELPVTVVREPGAADRFVYGESVRTQTRNSQGVDVAAEDRSRRDGWQIPAFWGSPTALNGNLYYTTMLGVTYVIDGDSPVLDESALLSVNDLGPSGKTWSLNSISYANGVIYHRTAKRLFAIE